jgi:hypothetical protein
MPAHALTRAGLSAEFAWLAIPPRSGVVPDQYPRDGGKQAGDRRRGQHDRTPPEPIHQQPQRHACRHGPDDACQQPEPRKHRKITCREPVGREFEGHHIRNRYTAPDEQAAEAGPRHARRERKKDRACRGAECTDGEQPSWAPVVCEDPGGDLHQPVAVEVESREVAQGCCADAEIAHQFLGHHRRRQAVKEADDIEKRSEAPDEPGEAQRGIQRSCKGFTVQRFTAREKWK